VSLKTKIFLFLLILIFFSLGFFLGKNNQNNTSSYIEIRNTKNFKFINPLLECESASFSQNAALDLLKAKINSLLDKLTSNHQITLASVYYRDLNNGPWLGINEKEDFSPASLIKVPLMITYYKEAESNPDILKQSLVYTSQKDDLTQDIIPSVTLIPNQSYTIEELMREMIVYSDNQAYNLLLNNIDNQLLINTYQDLGVDLSEAFNNPDGNIIPVKSYASFFRVLFNASYLNNEMSEKALRLLSEVQYKDGLVKGVNNSNISIAHKFGERTFTDTGEKQLHDCGIIYIPQKPYLLCVMTRGNDFTKLASAIAQISETIYQDLTLKN
jgi:beta-lactamase class A